MLYRAFFCLRPPHSQPHGTRFFFLRRSRACFAPTRALTHRAFFTLALLHSQPHAFMLHAKPPSQMRQPRVFFFFVCAHLCVFLITQTKLNLPRHILRHAFCAPAVRLATRHALNPPVCYAFFVSFAFFILNFARILKNIFEILKLKDF